MRAWFFLSLLAGLAYGEAPTPLLAQAQDFFATRRAVSLEEALQLAAKNSQDLKAAEAQETQTSARADLVYSPFLPEAKLTGSYVLTSAEQKFDPSAFTGALEGAMEAAIRGAGPAYGNLAAPNQQVIDSSKASFHDQVASQLTPTTLVARHSLYGTFTLTQVVFSPQFFALKAVGDVRGAARSGTLEAREQVLLGVARVYLGLEGLAQLEKAAKDAEAVALRRERDAQAQAAVGTSTELAVLRAQSETAQARATLATLTGQRVALVALLEALVGEPVRPRDDVATTLEVALEDEAQAPWNSTWWVKASEQGMRARDRLNSVDQLGWLPTLALQGRANYNSNSGFAGTNFIADGVLSAEWSLYDRGVRSATTRENEAKASQQRAQLEASRVKARATWYGARANLAAAQVTLAQAEAQERLATRAQKQAEGAVALGMSTALELSDIDSKRFLAASAAAQARAQLEIRKVELAAAQGHLGKLAGLREE